MIDPHILETSFRRAMPPMYAIQSATSRAAIMLDMGGEPGVVAPGAFADVIAVSGDPLHDIKVLGMKGGKVFKGEKP